MFPLSKETDMKIITKTEATPNALSPNEAEMLAAFRASDDHTRNVVLKIARALAISNPRTRAPFLSLVQGGAS